MARTATTSGLVPFGWVEVSDAALQRLRRELEQKEEGVVDEMGVLAIHSGYADYFFPGTSVLQTRPRYLLFVCWNFLWLAQRGVTAANLLKRKDEADLWVTSQLVTAIRRVPPPGTSSSSPALDGVIGARVFGEDPPRLPVQRVDFIYWTALRRWGIYRSRAERTQLFRRWRASAVCRVGDEGASESDDYVIRKEPLAEFLVPPVPHGWQREESAGLDFELSGPEARWLQERLLALADVSEGPCLLAKAAELCAESPPRMEPDENAPLRPWNDPLALGAARAAGQVDRLERARQASQLGHYVRAIYGALVEWLVETTSAPRGAPPSRHYRDQLRDIAGNQALRNSALSLSLPTLYADVPRIPQLLRRCLSHVQQGLLRAADGGDPEAIFVDDPTLRLFEAVERCRKGSRARLPRTEQGAARRVGFGPKTIRVHDIDYRWNRVRYLLWDLHRGLARA